MSKEYCNHLQDAPEGHPTVETRNLWPDDQRLRKHGYRIFARPRTGPDWWERNGVLFTTADALNRLKGKDNVS